jgi:hypothetical protein
MPNQDRSLASIRVALPERIEPRSTARSLGASVRFFFIPLFNNSEDFRAYLASVGNEDSITKNRLFDRFKAITMLVATARDAGDYVLPQATEGEIYKHITNIMRREGLGLRARKAFQRREAARLLAEQAHGETVEGE